MTYQKTIEKMQNLHTKYSRNSTIIRKAAELAEKFNDKETEFTLDVHANTESHLDLTAGWFSGSVYKNGVLYESFRVDC